MRKLTDVRLVFTVSPELDIAGFYDISHEIGVEHPLYTQLIMALERISVSIPKTGLYEIKKEELEKQTKEFYSVHAHDVEKHCEQMHKHWNQYKNQFLHTCEELFSSETFMEVTEFTAYPTLWKVYIQQIEQCAISFPLATDMHDKDEAIYIVIHELLHAFFYQYVETVSNLQSRNDLWDIAEIFNSIVLNQARFKIFYPSHTVTAYPAHSDIIKMITRSDINDNDNAKLVIERIINYLNPRN